MAALRRRTALLLLLVAGLLVTLAPLGSAAPRTVTVEVTTSTGVTPLDGAAVESGDVVAHDYEGRDVKRLRAWIDKDRRSPDGASRPHDLEVLAAPFSFRVPELSEGRHEITTMLQVGRKRYYRTSTFTVVDGDTRGGSQPPSSAPDDPWRAQDAGTRVALDGAEVQSSAVAYHPYRGQDLVRLRLWVNTPRRRNGRSVPPTFETDRPGEGFPLTGLAPGRHEAIALVQVDGKRHYSEASFTIREGGGTGPSEPPPPPPPPPAQARLGLHTTAAELAVWRARAASGPYRATNDAQPNSPGDWQRIERNAALFLSDPQRFAWTGPTHDYPAPIRNNSSWPRQQLDAVPGKRDQAGAAEPLRDAAFRAMVLGSEAVPGATMSADERRRTLLAVKGALQRIVRSRYNDFSDERRYSRTDFGNAFHPAFQIARWITVVTFAYDYAQVADRSLWSTAERAEFVRWLDAAAQWYVPIVEKRRSGMFDDAGRPTAAADQPFKSALWSGGPQAEKVHARMDNHVPRLVKIPVLAGLLAELEEERTGTRTLDAARVRSLVALAHRSVRDYLVAEFVAQAPGNGGGNASGAGNFYRTTDGDPLDGWKYAIEHLGRNLFLADHVARSGDTSIFEQATTDGTSVSAGSLPRDGVTNGGPKTLLGATKQLLRFVDETSLPVRYGCGGCSDVRNRIDSRDERRGIDRVNEWETIQANVYFRDPYLRSIYDRSRSGTPPLPSSPKSAQGWIENGSDGSYPGVNLMFARMGDGVWPYP